MHRPTRTFVLPVPLSRMLGAYTPFNVSGPNICARIFIPVTNPIERLNSEIKRRTDVVGIFPNDDAIVRLVWALLLEQNDNRAAQRARSMTLETIAPMGDIDPISPPPGAS